MFNLCKHISLHLRLVASCCRVVQSRKEISWGWCQNSHCNLIKFLLFRFVIREYNIWYFRGKECNLPWFIGEDRGLMMGTVKVNGGGQEVCELQRWTEDEAANDDVRALICRLHTHTQMQRNCSHCSCSFVSPFSFLSACCLATRTPAMWLGCDSPGAATSSACSTHVIRIQTHVAYLCICALQLHTERTQIGVSACARLENCRSCSFYLLLYEKGFFVFF